MHEASLAMDMVRMIEEVAAKHGVTEVVSARVQLGEITHVDQHTLGFAFEVVRKGTIAEGCTLEFEHVALMVECPACGFEGAGDRELLGCPSCGGVPVNVLKGRELRLVSIEVPDEDDD